MEITEIKELLAQFDASTLTEFDLRDGHFELYFNKNSDSRKGSASQAASQMSITPSMPVPTPGAEHPHLGEKAVANESLPTTAKSTPEEAEGTAISSPVVGIVYLQPSPDKPAFKSVGDRVKKGEVVCIVEAMKVMNEITSDIEGEIVAVMVENEQVVEFNQPLFKVKEG